MATRPVARAARSFASFEVSNTVWAPAVTSSDLSHALASAMSFLASKLAQCDQRDVQGMSTPASGRSSPRNETPQP